MSRGAVAAAAETRAAIHGVSRQANVAGRDLGKLSRGALAGSGAFRGLGRSLAFASGGFLGGYGLTAAISGAVTELRDSIKVSAQTAQALRSTGNVAGISARDIDQLAQSLLRKTGVDDEAIKTSENLLLTFTQVRNEAGKGNDIFNQATRAVVDMSAVIGDLSSNSIQLGKALNDPVKGMTALRRVGVSFTSQQIEQVKAMVKAGDVLGAQKLILRELRTEFGGQAAAQERATGGLNTLRETVKNLSAELLRSLMPSFRQLVAWLQKQVDWLTKTREGQAKLRAVSAALRKGLHDIVAVVRALVGAFQAVGKVTGSTTHTFELLLGLGIGVKVLAWARAFRALGAAAGIAGGTAGVGGLLGVLTRLKTLGPIAISLVIAERLKTDPTFGLGRAHSITDVLFGPKGDRGIIGNKIFGSGKPAPAVPNAGPERTMGHGGRSPAPNRPAGAVTVAPGANRSGVHLKGHVIAFVARVAAVEGRTLQITTGTNHNEYVVGTHRQSQHWTGDAADIAASGASLTHLGQSALIAAGADPGWARRQTGGAFTINGVQCIFNSMIGGNHFNHLHVGLASLPPAAAGRGTRSVSPHSSAVADAAGRGHGTVHAAGGGGWMLGGLDAALQVAKAKARQATADTTAAAAHAADKQISHASKTAMKVFEQEGEAWHATFDKETTGRLRAMQKATSAHLKEMQRGFAATMKEFDRETERGLAGLAAPAQTPTEALLAGRAATRHADDVARALAEARQGLTDAGLSGDPKQIADAQKVLADLLYDIETEALTKQATAERDAADTNARAAQQAYSEQRQALSDALNEQQSDRENAFSEQAAAAEEAYQAERDALSKAEDERRAIQLEKYQEQYDDWTWLLSQKSKAWRRFLAWIKANPIGRIATGGLDIPDWNDNPGAVPAQWNTDLANAFGGDPGGRPKIRGFALGGKVPGSFVGTEDTVLARVSPGETVIDRRLTAALERMVENGGGGRVVFAPNFTFNGHVTDQDKLVDDIRAKLVDVGRRQGGGPGSIFGGNA